MRHISKDNNGQLFRKEPKGIPYLILNGHVDKTSGQELGLYVYNLDQRDQYNPLGDDAKDGKIAIVSREELPFITGSTLSLDEADYWYYGLVGISDYLIGNHS